MAGHSFQEKTKQKQVPKLVMGVLTVEMRLATMPKKKVHLCCVKLHRAE